MLLEIKAFNKEQLANILAMLAYLEECSELGHCGTCHITIDGDGNGKIKINCLDDNLQKEYEEGKKIVCKNLIENNKYKPHFIIGE